MRKYYILCFSFILSISVVRSQYTLTDNDINFKKASYNSSMIVADSNNLVLNLTTSLSDNLQQTSRMHLLAYGNFAPLGLGIGVKFNSRFKSYFETTSAEFLIAKNINFDDANTLNFGMNFGIEYIGINPNFFNQFVDQTDEFIQSNPTQGVRFITGFGASYSWRNKLMLGFSMPELVKTTSDFYPTIFSNVAYKQPLGKIGTMYVQPELFLYSTNIAPATLEGSTSFGYKNYTWLKLGARSNKTLILGLGGGYNFVEVGYNYNMNFSNYQVVNQMQHNINVCFNFLQMGKSKALTNENNDSFKGDISNIDFPYSVTTTKVESEIQSRYYIVVESFKTEDEALNVVDNQLSQGQKSFIIREVNSGIYHVCLDNDNDFDEITNKVIYIKNNMHPDAWIIENK